MIGQGTAEAPRGAERAGVGHPKIVHLIGQLVRGGAERQLLLITAALQERGWEQMVITFNPGDVWEAPLRQQGTRLGTIPRSPLKPWRLARLAHIVRRERPLVVQSWSPHTNLYATLLQRLPLGRPRPRLILSLRRTPLEDQMSGQPLARLPHAAIYGQADYLISNSQLALDQLLTQDVRLPGHAVVGNIVTAQGRARAGEAVAVPRLVAAGALIPRKAYDVLLQALGRLAAQGKFFELHLAGEGEERPRLEKLADDLGIRARVRFLGGVENVSDLIADAHILVHPSRSEGLSNTVLEGLAEGVAVVATRVGAVPEMVEHEVTGLLVPPDDVEALAHALGRLWGDPALRARLGQTGLGRVRERCSVDTVAAQYEAVYRAVLQQR